ncbi:MAG: ATP-binding protein [Candidatus Hadarchaeales archaeon]
MFEGICRLNPWWTEKDGLEKDEDFLKWREAKIRWEPLLLSELPLEPFSLNFVFGPRQVGKTTLLKLLVRKLLSKGIEPERIFYFKCEKLADYKELDEVLKAYFEFRKSRGISSSYILLDEITFPTEWFRTVKYYIDVGEFKGDVVIVTGSLSMYLKKEVELFPGRRGKDLVMLPLSFREYVKVLCPEIELPRLEGLGKTEIFEKSYSSLPHLGKIEELFEKYVKTGGFPLPVREGGITDSIRETYWNWIRVDLAKIGRSEETFRRVAKAILEKAPSSLSLNSIAKEFEIGTHKTAFEYLDIMEKLYIVKVLYHLDPNRLLASFRKNRKIHFMDPLFFDLFSDVCLSKIPEESVVLESVVASHLARRFEAFYWKNWREIDIIAKRKEELAGFEVKSREGADYSKMRIGKIGNVFCLGEELDRERNLLSLPLFLSLL